MPKAPKPPKPKKRPRKLAEHPVAHGVAITREATEQEIGDTADKITRARKKR